MSSLYRKYRPQTFADLIAQDHVKQTIQHQIAQGTLAHAYLFMGPRGVGKTTTARLIAKAFNCQKVQYQAGTSRDIIEPCNVCSSCVAITGGHALDVMEIDAASNTGVDHVREHIIDAIRFIPHASSFKVFIIDEVHMLSSSAFNALLKTLEEPPAHAVFILATTEIHKIPETIISRCQRFDFKRVPAKELVERLQILIKEEQVEVSDEVLYEIARHSDGCVRDAESLLGQILAIGEKTIGLKEASLVLPASNMLLVVDFAKVLLQKDAREAIRLLNTYIDQGVELSHFLEDLTAFLRTLLFVCLGGIEAAQETFQEEVQKQIVLLSQTTDSGFLTEAIERFLESRRLMKTDKIPQVSAEIAIMRLCVSQHTPHEQKKSLDIPSALESQSFLPVNKSAPSLSDNAVLSSPQENKEMIQTDKTIFDTVPVLNLEEVKEKWPQIFERLQEKHASLPLVLKAGELKNVQGNEVRVGFEYTFHVEMLNDHKHKHVIEDVLRSVLGSSSVRFSAIHQKVEADPETDQVVSKLLDAFGGSAI